jgi:hypothetical protein
MSGAGIAQVGSWLRDSERRFRLLAFGGALTMFLVQPPADLWMLGWLAPLPWLAIVQQPRLAGRRPWLERGPRRATATLRARVQPDGRRSPWLALGAVAGWGAVAVVTAATVAGALRPAPGRTTAPAGGAVPKEGRRLVPEPRSGRE